VEFSGEERNRGSLQPFQAARGEMLFVEDDDEHARWRLGAGHGQRENRG
jgi:hypothetical protein